jgi:hypothetical protein
MTSFGRSNPCPNLNHRRTNSPVGHCPECGAVVNQNFHVAACSAAEHEAARRRRSVFCVNCGIQLIDGLVARVPSRYESE